MAKIEVPYTLIIPTFQRTSDLNRCLDSIDKLNYRFTEVNIVVRNTDYETIDFLTSQKIQFLTVYQPGLIAAMKIGIEYSNCEILVFIDDDTELNDNWITNAITIFQDSRIGAVGGRDIQPLNPLRPNQTEVGKFKKRGKLVGNHHLYSGPAREVDFLKGCNMFIRRSTLKMTYEVLDKLKGSGAQWGGDLVISIASRLGGLKTIFHPSVSLVHHASPRKNELRNPTSEQQRAEISFNSWLIKMIFSYRYTLPLVIFFGLFVGDRLTPGLLRSISLNKYRIGAVLFDLRITFKAFISALILVPDLRNPLPKN